MFGSTMAAKTVFLISVLLMIYACGGGSDEPVSVPKTIPNILVNAGQNITVEEEMTVTLSGTASGGDGVLTYTWQVSPFISVSQENELNAAANLVAPVVAQDTDYLLTLVVTDEAGNSGQDSVTLSVVSVNRLPVASIEVQQAAGYAPNTFPVQTEVTLDGSNSSDSDPFDNSLPAITYQWQQTFGEPLLLGQETTLPTLTFTTVTTQIEHVAGFRLTVTDQNGASATQELELTFLRVADTIPSVSLNSIASVLSGELINLTALPDSPASSAFPFLINWQDDSNVELTYLSMHLKDTYAVAPQVDEPTEIVFSVEATDIYGNVASDSQGVLVLPYTFEKINDTGVFINANETRNTALYQAEYPGQDAHRGKDTIANNNLDRKAGRGEQGFDFTRLNQNGEELDNATQPWSCVRDNTTALIWQIKQPASTTSIHGGNARFTWFAEDDNGDFEGHLNSSSTSCLVANGNCNTLDYVNQTNQEGLCGFFDWRLPTPDELMSIVHYGTAQVPMVDTQYFLNMASENDIDVWYWTAQSNADGVTDDSGAQSVWVIDFGSGTDGFINKASELRTILVRAGRGEE